MFTWVRTPGTRCASRVQTAAARVRAKSRNTRNGPAPAPPTHVTSSPGSSAAAKLAICRRCAGDSVVESGGNGRSTSERVVRAVSAGGTTVVVVGATAVVVGAMVVIEIGATVVVVEFVVGEFVEFVGAIVVAGVTETGAGSGAVVVVDGVGGATVVVVVGATVVVVVVVGATVVVVVVGATVVVVVGATVVVVVGATVVVVVVGATVVVVVVVVVGTVGVSESLISDGAPSPIALRAVTRNRYAVALVRPLTVAESEADTPSLTVTHSAPSLVYCTT